MGRVIQARAHVQELFLAITTMLMVAGGAAWVTDGRRLADVLWIVATCLGLGLSTWRTAVAVRRRRPSVDVIALLALVGALVVREPLAGAMIALMLASGQLLEARASNRAERELSLLVDRAPRSARRRTPGGVVVVTVEEVVVGDLLLVGAGEVVPVDGRLQGVAVLDESALTGEARPRERRAGEGVRSGVLNTATPLELVATATASESTYAGLVRLVEQAQASSAPFVRTADRLAVLFVPLTLLVAGGAWAITGDAVRAVAVLVVATPCPLLLAAPIAVMSGLSRAARAGVIIKGGAALERLAAGRVVLFDKTGTLTSGRPALTDVVTADDGPSGDELLRLAASLDQVSPHVLAGAIVTAGSARGLALTMPADVHEVLGRGLEGIVDGRRVRLGKAGWVVGQDEPAWVRRVRRRADLEGSITVFVSVDGLPAGALLLEDPIRPEAPRMVRALKAAGISRVVLVTGDRADIAKSVGRVVGVDAVFADCDPAGKLAAIGREAQHGPTIMVGDGVNDAPALAAAGAGVALAARGSTASSEAADVVLTVDRLDALADALLVVKRARSVAVQAVAIGMGLSLVAMGAAAVGWLPPVTGAVVQELIDLLAIGVALRALLPGPTHTVVLADADLDMARTLRIQHDAVRPTIERIRWVADRLSSRSPDLGPARALLAELEGVLLPHERADEQLLVPMVARALGGTDATAAMSRTHAEIEHQVGRLRGLLAQSNDPDGDVDLADLRLVLYGLYAVLRLHDSLEEQEAFSLVRETSPADRRSHA